MYLINVIISHQMSFSQSLTAMKRWTLIWITFCEKRLPIVILSKDKSLLKNRVKSQNKYYVAIFWLYWEIFNRFKPIVKMLWVKIESDLNKAQQGHKNTRLILSWLTKPTCPTWLILWQNVCSWSFEKDYELWRCLTKYYSSKWPGYLALTLSHNLKPDKLFFTLLYTRILLF